MESLSLKQRLLAECLKQQKSIVAAARYAMEDAQNSAKEHDEAGEEKLFDSYREEMQNKRDMFAKQFEQSLDDLAMLDKLDPIRQSSTVGFGSIVITENQKLFVSISIGQIVVDDDTTYFAISPSAPLAKAMFGKKAGETFEFRDKKTAILQLF